LGGATLGSATGDAALRVPALPADLTPESPITALPLSARAESAVERLGVTTVAALAALDSASLSVLRNVGRQTVAQLPLLRHARRPPLPPPPPARPRAPTRPNRLLRAAHRR